MNKSESIKELATALNKAQAEMSGAQKKSKNPFFNSSFANLEEVINCVKTPFMNNGLSYMQFPVAEQGRAGVETIIMHDSGEWISNTLLLTCAKDDPQGMGSAITYARRYSLQAAAGVPSEDDDGNRANGNKPLPTYTPQPQPIQKPEQPQVELITAEEAATLRDIAKTKDHKKVRAMLDSFQVSKFEQLPKAYLNNVKKAMGIK